MVKDDIQKVTLVGVETERFVQEFEPRHIVDEETGELKQVTSGMDKYGKELPDPVPMAPPVGFMQTPPLKDLIRQMVRDERFRMAAEEAGADTFEESEDFDTGEDGPDPQTPYELEFDPEFVEKKEDYAAMLKGPAYYEQYLVDKKKRREEAGIVKVQQVGGTNGDTGSQQRRVDDRDSGSRQPDSGNADNAESGRNADDAGSRGKAAGGAPKAAR